MAKKAKKVKKVKEEKLEEIEHELVPKHILLTPEEGKEVLKNINAKIEQFPKIFAKDPCAKAIGAQVGDIIKIIQKSPTAKEAIRYRTVVMNKV